MSGIGYLVAVTGSTHVFRDLRPALFHENCLAWPIQDSLFKVWPWSNSVQKRQILPVLPRYCPHVYFPTVGNGWIGFILNSKKPTTAIRCKLYFDGIFTVIAPWHDKFTKFSVTWKEESVRFAHLAIIETVIFKGFVCFVFLFLFFHPIKTHLGWSRCLLGCLLGLGLLLGYPERRKDRRDGKI